MSEEENNDLSIELFNKLQLQILQEDLKPDMASKVGGARGYLSISKMREALIKAIMKVDRTGYFQIVTKQNSEQDPYPRLQLKVKLGGKWIELEHEESYLGHAYYEKLLIKDNNIQLHVLNSIEQYVTTGQSYAKRRLLSLVLGIDEKQ